MITGIVAGFTKAGEALPILPQPDSMQYWFAADRHVYSDAGSTSASAGDPVQQWNNLGTNDDAIQPTPANRPTFRTDGINGRPYLECNSSVKQYFAPLAGMAQPSGFSGVNDFTVLAVIDQATLNGQSYNPITGFSGSFSGLYKNEFGLKTSAVNGDRFYFGRADTGALNRVVPNPGGANVIMGQKRAGNVGNWGEGSQSLNYTTFYSASNRINAAVSTTEFLKSGSQYFHGHIYEFIYWSYSLAEAEANDVLGYLRDKYALS